MKRVKNSNRILPYPQHSNFRILLISPLHLLLFSLYSLWLLQKQNIHTAPVSIVRITSPHFTSHSLSHSENSELSFSLSLYTCRGWGKWKKRWWNMLRRRRRRRRRSNTLSPHMRLISTTSSTPLVSSISAMTSRHSRLAKPSSGSILPELIRRLVIFSSLFIAFFYLSLKQIFCHLFEITVPPFLLQSIGALLKHYNIWSFRY